jgi:phosphoglycerol transferase MdoB-like AlkP superfamily enzyme
VTVGNLVSGFGAQIDVMPTVLSYLNLSYTNNTFGVDLNNSKRDFAIYNYDDRFAVIDSSLIFVQKYDRSFAGVYSLKNAEAINCKELSQECDKLKNAGQSILQFYSNFEANCMK